MHKLFNISIIIILSVIALSTADTAYCQSGPSVVISTTDDALAAKQLISFLEQNGVTTSGQGDGWFILERNDLRYSLSPNMLESLDRIIVVTYFSVKPQYRNSQRLITAVMKLNKELNIGQFSIDDDGDLLYLSMITFVDQLYLEEINAFFTWDETLVLKLVVGAPDLLEILE
ncbi:MAG: YbjN domain-containing protein [Candidatus Electryoneaceae bacterium]|nr:YbjN domain-containing protein [Candidatus Electryoneaceae bacterium]